MRPPISGMPSLAVGPAPTAPDETLPRIIEFGDSNWGFQAGTITGPVTTEVHHHPPGMSVFCNPILFSTDQSLAIEAPELSPNPLSTALPFGRDPDYVQQGSLLKELRLKLSRSGRAALVGMGGIGYVPGVAFVA
jgi:hypothetical protein